MAGKFEKLESLAFVTASVDDWIDKKKKLEGAEGLWRIHNKLYDFTLWSRTHPGGKFWIDVTRGTDITEVFESHHLSNEPESLLLKYYRREAATPRNFFTTFNENEFYKIFKRKVAQSKLAEADKRSWTVQVISDCLVAAVFLTGLLAIKYGATWTVASGIFLGFLSISSHNFFHSKENWRIFYFDLSLMSSRDWKIRHVLSHHQYRNTYSDLEIPIWNALSGSQLIFGKYAKLMANLFMFFVAAHLQFLQRVFNVFLSYKLGFNSEELVALSFPLFLFFFGGMRGWEAFLTWNLIVMIASLCYCLFSSNFYLCSTEASLKEETQREKQDFGIVQLSHTENNYEENNFAFSFLNSFRNNALHYLCPRINCERLYEFAPLVEDAIQEAGITYIEKPIGFPDIFEGKMPQGYTFFS